MRFDDQSCGRLDPGTYVARIASAVEKAIPWDRERLGLFLGLQIDFQGELFTVEQVLPLDNPARLAVVCRSAGIDPRGDVDPSALVGRLVSVSVELRRAKSTGNEYYAVAKYDRPPAPAVETRPAVVQGPAARSQVRRSEPEGSDDIPF